MEGLTRSRLAGDRPLANHAAVVCASLALSVGGVYAQERGIDTESCARGELRVSGTVVDRRTGLALPDARVRLEVTVGQRGEAPRNATVDQGGAFVTCAPAGTERIRLTARWGKERSETTELVPPASDVRLAVDMGPPTFLLFSVVDEDTGEPVTGAVIRLRPLPLTAVTDTLGRAVFRRVPPGGYEVAVSHLAYHPMVDSVAAEKGPGAELRVPLAPRAIPLKPLQVTVTGRDPYLVNVGFYDRRRNLREGYWGLPEQIRPYQRLSTLLEFQRDLFLHYRDPALILINGRPMERLGYEDLDEVLLQRIRGLEAIRCGELPARYMGYLAADASLDCNALLIWVR